MVLSCTVFDTYDIEKIQYYSNTTILVRGHRNWYHLIACVYGLLLASYLSLKFTVLRYLFALKKYRDLEDWVRDHSMSLQMTSFDRSHYEIMFTLTCVKFGQLTVRKIIRHQMPHFMARTHQIRFRLGLSPWSRWGAYSGAPHIIYLNLRGRLAGGEKGEEKRGEGRDGNFFLGNTLKLHSVD